MSSTIYVTSRLWGIIAVPCEKVTAKMATATERWAILGHTKQVRIDSASSFTRLAPGFSLTPEEAKAKLATELYIQVRNAKDALEKAKSDLDLATEHLRRLERGDQIAVRAVEEADKKWAAEEDRCPGPFADDTLQLA